MPHVSRDERGQSLSLLVLVVLTALLMVAGLVIDGGSQSRATRRAEQAASEAARAAIDAAVPAWAVGVTPDPVVMTTAAQRLLAERGIDGTVQIDGSRVVVGTRAQVPTVFLSLVGINSLPANGSAVAEVRAP